MNILKKLKLALLATSVMFFSQAGNAFDQEKDVPTALTRSIPASSSQSEEIASGAPTAKKDVTDFSLLSLIYGKDLDTLLRESEQFSTLKTDKEDLRKIREAHEETSSEEFDARVAALKKFTSFAVLDSNTAYTLAARERHFFDFVKVSATALKLPVSAIKARGDAINKMVERLFTYELSRSSLQYGLPLAALAEKLRFKFTDSKAALIDYAFTLSPEEILERAAVLKKHEFLLTKLLDFRPKIINSLFRKKPDEIDKRAKILRSGKYIFGEVIAGASEVEVDVLEKNVQLITGPLVGFLENGPEKGYMGGSIDKLIRPLLDCNPEDTASRLVALQQNWDALSKVIRDRDAQMNVIFTALIKIPSDEIINRAVALIQYKDFLPPAFNKGRIFMNKSADEIYAIARSQQPSLEPLLTSSGPSTPSSSSQ